MATEIDTTAELEAFHAFLGKCLAAGKANFKLDESIARFRAYQADFERLKSRLDKSLEKLDRGERGQEIDFDEFLKEAHQRWADKQAND